jgi:hypothetical protein
MKSSTPPPPKPTIRCSVRLEGNLLVLPKSASATLPRGEVEIEATLNGFPFRARFGSDGSGRHTFKLTAATLAAAEAQPGDTVALEITRAGEETATRVPADLQEALATSPRAAATWAATTPSARRDWILWLSSGKQIDTRTIRIKKACSMLGAGKKRVCCFGGLGWLRKDHPAAGESWRPLPKA